MLINSATEVLTETGEGNPLWWRDLNRVQSLLDEIEPLANTGIKRETLAEDVMVLFPQGTPGRKMIERKLIGAKKDGHGSARGMKSWLYAKERQQSKPSEQKFRYKYPNFRSFVPGESNRPTYPKRKGKTKKGKSATTSRSRARSTMVPKSWLGSSQHSQLQRWSEGKY